MMLMFAKECVCVCVRPHLHPFDAGLYPQLVHRPPGVVDVVGAVGLRRHGGDFNAAGRGKRKYS